MSVNILSFVSRRRCSRGAWQAAFQHADSIPVVLCPCRASIMLHGSTVSPAPAQRVQPSLHRMIALQLKKSAGQTASWQANQLHWLHSYHCLLRRAGV